MKKILLSIVLVLGMQTQVLAMERISNEDLTKAVSKGMELCEMDDKELADALVVMSNEVAEKYHLTPSIAFQFVSAVLASRTTCRIMNEESKRSLR